MPAARSSSEDRRFAEFVQIVAHEVARPLTPALGFYRTLLNHGDEIPENDREHMRRRVLVDLQRLARLVHSLDHLAQVTLGDVDIQPTPFALRPLIDEALRELGEAHPDRTVDVSCDGSIKVSGDPVLVLAAVENVLENAQSFSRPGTPIRAECSLDDGHVTLDIVNTDGVLSAPEARRIYDGLVDLDRETVGVGLGLYIARAIVHALDGEIWVEEHDPARTVHVRLAGAARRVP